MRLVVISEPLRAVHQVLQAELQILQNFIQAGARQAQYV